MIKQTTKVGIIGTLILAGFFSAYILGYNSLENRSRNFGISIGKSQKEILEAKLEKINNDSLPDLVVRTKDSSMYILYGVGEGIFKTKEQIFTETIMKMYNEW